MGWNDGCRARLSLARQPYLGHAQDVARGSRCGCPADRSSVSVSDLWFQSSARGEKRCAGVYEGAWSPALLEGVHEWVDVRGLAGVAYARLLRISLKGFVKSRVDRAALVGRVPV